MSDTNQPPEPPDDKHAGGRPLKYETVKQLDQAIRAYFDTCDPHVERRVVDCGINQRGETIWKEREVMTDQKPYTVSGLAVSLGISRTTLLSYKERPEFLNSISAAIARCEQYAESMLYSPYSNGAKFNLTNNYEGWADKKEVDHTTQGMPILGGTTPLPVDDEDQDEEADAPADE